MLDKFVEKLPELKHKARFQVKPEPAKENINMNRLMDDNDDGSMVTETLARVYIKQKHYGKAIKGLSYKVQVAEIKQNYNSRIIVDYPDAMVESSADSKYYKYTIGLYKTFESANYLRKELQRQGITIAEVVPFINGIRLSESESASQSASYPDLLNFMDSASQN